MDIEKESVKITPPNKIKYNLINGIQKNVCFVNRIGNTYELDFLEPRIINNMYNYTFGG